MPRRPREDSSSDSSRSRSRDSSGSDSSGKGKSSAYKEKIKNASSRDQAELQEERIKQRRNEKEKESSSGRRATSPRRSKDHKEESKRDRHSRINTGKRDKEHQETHRSRGRRSPEGNKEKRERERGDGFEDKNKRGTISKKEKEDKCRSEEAERKRTKDETNRKVVDKEKEPERQVKMASPVHRSSSGSNSSDSSEDEDPRPTQSKGNQESVKQRTLVRYASSDSGSDTRRKVTRSSSRGRQSGDDSDDESSVRKVVRRVETDDIEKHGDTPEKDGIEETLEEGEVRDEKEEGEISEEEGGGSPAKPLIAISEDMSDISSEDEVQSTTKTKPAEQKRPQTPPSPANEAQAHNNSAKPSSRKVEESPSPPRKVEQITGNTSPSDAKEGSKSRIVMSPEVEKTEENNSMNKADGPDVGADKEDGNARMERPELESESEEESNESNWRKNLGSSVSVVKQAGEELVRDGGGDIGGRSRVEERRRDDRDQGRRSKRDERDSRRDREDQRNRERRDDRRGIRDDDRRRRRRSPSREERDDDKRGSRHSKEQKFGGGDADQGASKEAAAKGSKATPGPSEAGGDGKTAAETATAAKKDVITTRTGGAYIPPAKLRMMQEQITDKTSVAYQRMSWEALKKSINGLINKVNVSNLVNIIKELFQENIVRGRGLLARSVIQAQAASPTFTHVYAAFVAIINTKFPQNGELILRRLVLQFRQGYRRNNKALCLSSTRFIAHLVNQQVAHELLALEILTLLLETPTVDSVEVAIGFLKESGQKLTEVSPRGINSIFERLRTILHEGMLDKRVEYMVEVMFAVRKDGFKDHPAVQSELDLVEEEEQFTHLLQLEDAVKGDNILNIFKEDPNFAESEEKYKTLKKEILDEGSSEDESDDGEGSSESESSETDEEAEEKENAEKQKILDQTETNLVALRRVIYLTIQSSLDHNECAHKMLKMELKPGQEVELCNMILDCCAQLRTYEKFFGLLAQRFCQIDRKYIEPFQQIFVEQFETIHRLETNKLRNVAKFFAHMLHTDAISWGVLSVIKLTEDDTTSASRIFLKILFQELSEFLGLLKLNQRLKDPTLSPFFEGILPRDNPKNTRFSINFFTTIGLGGLTDDLREHLKNVTKKIVQEKQEEAQAELARSKPDSSSSSSSDDSDSSSDSSKSGEDSDSESSDSEVNATFKRKKTSGSSSKAKARKSRASADKREGRKEEKHRGRQDSKRKEISASSSNTERKSGGSKNGPGKERGKDQMRNEADRGSKKGDSKGSRHAINGKGKGRDSPEKGMSIAARLLSMAEYGDIAQAAGDSQREMEQKRKSGGRNIGEVDKRDRGSGGEGIAERKRMGKGREDMEDIYEDRGRNDGGRRDEGGRRRSGSRERKRGMVKEVNEDQWMAKRRRRTDEVDTRRDGERDRHFENYRRDREDRGWKDVGRGRGMDDRDRRERHLDVRDGRERGMVERDGRNDSFEGSSGKRNERDRQGERDRSFDNRDGRNNERDRHFDDRGVRDDARDKNKFGDSKSRRGGVEEERGRGRGSSREGIEHSARNEKFSTRRSQKGGLNEEKGRKRQNVGEDGARKSQRQRKDSVSGSSSSSSDSDTSDSEDNYRSRSAVKKQKQHDVASSKGEKLDRKPTATMPQKKSRKNSPSPDLSSSNSDSSSSEDEGGKARLVRKEPPKKSMPVKSRDSQTQRQRKKSPGAERKRKKSASPSSSEGSESGSDSSSEAPPPKQRRGMDERGGSARREKEGRRVDKSRRSVERKRLR